MLTFAVNPASRSGRAGKLWEEELKPILRARGVDYRVRFSEAAGGFTTLVRELTEEAGEQPLTLVILGGDGTVNEALQGLECPSRVELGYIPTGSSNDLARDLGLPKDPKEALLRVLSAKEARPMDMGVVALPDGREHRFAVSCGVGFDAAVCEGVDVSRAKEALNRMGLGKLTYLAVALKTLFSTHLPDCRVFLDGGEEIDLKKLLFAAGMVHRFEGGGFRFCPDADAADGLLDLCTVNHLPRLLVLLALPTAFFGKHLIFPGVSVKKAKTLRIASEEPLCVHTDGEVLGHFKEVSLRCEAGALRLRC